MKNPFPEKVYVKNPITTQWGKALLLKPTSHIGGLVQVQNVLYFAQIPANIPGKTVEYTLIFGPAIHKGDLSEVPGPWLQPGSDLVFLRV